jgi:D-alanine-D-alanine ligase
MKKLIAIAAGGDSAEEEISLLSAQTVLENLNRTMFEPVLVRMRFGKWEAHYQGEVIVINKNDFSFDFKDKKRPIDYVFIAIHGTPGEDGKLQAYFDLLKIPYSSPNHIGATLTFNKWYCNTLLKQLGFLVAKSQYLRKNENFDSKSILEKLGLPCFVKPCSCGSSYGISKVKTGEELAPAIKKAFEYDHEIMIESQLSGREMTCGVYREKGEIKALPITEIIPKGEFFDYAAKYQGDSQEITPAHIPDKWKEKIQKIARAVYDKLDMRGIVRVDFMLVDDQPFIIELNAVPGLSPNSLIPQQVKAADLSLTDFFTTLIEETIEN